MKTLFIKKSMTIATLIAIVIGSSSCGRTYIDGQLQGDLKVSNIYYEPKNLSIFDDMVVRITKRNGILYFDIQNYYMQIGVQKVSVKCNMSNDTLSIVHKYFDSGINGVTRYDCGFCVQPVTLTNIVIKADGGCTPYIPLKENEAVEVYRRKYDVPDDLTGL